MSLTLLQRIARGEQEAVPACLAEYGNLVWSIARRFTTDRAEAEDATQDIFVDLWKNSSRYDPAISSEATFISMIARRRLTDRSRKRGRSVPTTSLPDDDSPSVPSVSDQISISDEVAHVRDTMKEISQDQRTVLEMAIDRGMTQSDIAKSLGMPVGTVKAHARRGLIRLRELLTLKSSESIQRGDVL